MPQFAHSCKSQSTKVVFMNAEVNQVLAEAITSRDLLAAAKAPAKASSPARRALFQYSGLTRQKVWYLSRATAFVEWRRHAYFG
jgi:hypothetical protein